MKTVTKIILWVLAILVICAIAFAGFFVYMLLTEGQPVQNKTTSTTNTAPMFSFQIDSDAAKTGTDLTVKDVTGKTVQVINIPDVNLTFYKLAVADVVNDNADINFDGYNDLQVTEEIPADNPPAIAFYIYNPSTGMFSNTAMLPNLIGPVFDPVKKTITSEQSGGCAGEVREDKTYSFIAGKYLLTSDQNYNCCTFGQDPNSAVITTTTSADGKITTTKTACPAPQN